MKTGSGLQCELPANGFLKPQDKDVSEPLSPSLMNQSINSLNNSSFAQLEGSLACALPASLFGAAEPQRKQTLTEQVKSKNDEEEKAPETARKDPEAKGKSQALNHLLSGISPIQHDLDLSALQQSRYSNILNSERSNHSEKLNIEDICIELNDESHGQPLSSSVKAAQAAIRSAQRK